MYYALVDSWWGMLCTVHHNRSPAPFAYWARVPREEWEELTEEGFRTCVSWAVRPQPD